MALRHLRDLLSEEQEPFTLQSFIDERQGLLKFREASSLCKKSPLLSSSPFPAAILIGSTSRVQKLRKRNHLFCQKRRKRKCSTDEDCPRSLGLSFLASLFKRLVLRKQRHRVMRCQEEDDDDDAKDKKNEKEDLQRAVEIPADQRATKEKQCEEKEEQHSPVSVLDPLPSDGEDDAPEQDEEEDDGEASSFHKAKQDLLRRLRRFEKLADLEPLQLDKALAEDEDEEDGGKRVPLKSPDLCREKRRFRREIEVTVETDMGHEEGDDWRRFSVQVAELAAVFSVQLASELAEDFVQTLHFH